LLSVPLRLKDRLLGDIDFFYRKPAPLADADRSLLETLASHLACAIEVSRVDAPRREAAVSEERSLIARELHDSIAQGLAFLKIQSGLLRDEVAGMPAGQTERLRHTLAELDTGIRESLADVRELLLHFRTRGDDEDILPALHTTLAKFQHQRGCPRTWRRMARAWPCRRMYRSRCCMRCRRRCPRPASMPVQARNGST
jgi:two-component system, NarL family, nitrate/nitrite sensor histidine kinase NarX